MLRNYSLGFFIFCLQSTDKQNSQTIQKQGTKHGYFRLVFAELSPLGGCQDEKLGLDIFFFLCFLYVSFSLAVYLAFSSASIAASYSYHKSDPNKTISYRKIRNKSCSSVQHMALWITWRSFLSLKPCAFHDMYISSLAKKESRSLLSHYKDFYYLQSWSNLSIISEAEKHDIWWSN